MEGVIEQCIYDMEKKASVVRMRGVSARLREWRGVGACLRDVGKRMSLSPFWNISEGRGMRTYSLHTFKIDNTYRFIPTKRLLFYSYLLIFTSNLLVIEQEVNILLVLRM